MTVTDSGSTVTEVRFNMDTDLQIVHMESTVNVGGASESYNILADHKGVRAVFLLQYDSRSRSFCMQQNMF